MKRFDKPLYGAILGLILPLFGYIMGKYIVAKAGTWNEYWHYFLGGGDYTNQIFTWCMLPTLFSFYFVFFYWKLDHASKGLVAVSLVQTAIFMIIKYV